MNTDNNQNTPDLSKLDETLVKFENHTEDENELGRVLAEGAVASEEILTQVDEAYLAQLEEGHKEMDEIAEQLKKEQETGNVDDVRKKLSEL